MDSESDDVVDGDMEVDKENGGNTWVMPSPHL